MRRTRAGRVGASKPCHDPSIRLGSEPRSGSNVFSTRPPNSSTPILASEFTVQEKWSNAPGNHYGSSTNIFGESTICSWPCSKSRCRPRPANPQERLAGKEGGLNRLHCFVVEYYRICRPTRPGEASPNGRAPVHDRIRPAAVDGPPQGSGPGVFARRHPCSRVCSTRRLQTERSGWA